MARHQSGIARLEPTVEFRLRAPALDLFVDVRLRSFGDRWTASAEIAGRETVGLAATPRGALGAALSGLRPSATAALLVDPELFEASRKVL